MFEDQMNNQVDAVLEAMDKWDANHATKPALLALVEPTSGGGGWQIHVRRAVEVFGVDGDGWASVRQGRKSTFAPYAATGKPRTVEDVDALERLASALNIDSRPSQGPQGVHHD